MNHNTIKNNQQQTDSFFIEEYGKTGDSKYLGELYKYYKGKVFAKCISMLNDHSLANDAIQDIFVKVLTNIHKFNKELSFSTRLYTITYNHCIDIMRKRKKDRTETLIDSHNNIWDDDQKSVITDDQFDALYRALHNLSPDDQDILFMKYDDEKSMMEIRAALEQQEGKYIKDSAIKMRLLRARQRAQKNFISIITANGKKE